MISTGMRMAASFLSICPMGGFRGRQDGTEPFLVKCLIGPIGNDNGQSLVQQIQQIPAPLRNSDAELLLESGKGPGLGLKILRLQGRRYPPELVIFSF